MLNAEARTTSDEDELPYAPGDGTLEGTGRPRADEELGDGLYLHDDEDGEVTLRDRESFRSGDLEATDRRIAHIYESADGPTLLTKQGLPVSAVIALLRRGGHLP